MVLIDCPKNHNLYFGVGILQYFSLHPSVSCVFPGCLCVMICLSLSVSLFSSGRGWRPLCWLHLCLTCTAAACCLISHANYTSPACSMKDLARSPVFIKLSVALCGNVFGSILWRFLPCYLPAHLRFRVLQNHLPAVNHLPRPQRALHPLYH